ncbi:cation-translocating P-type ATPase [Patulibacter brassicae]|jgi:cation-transporting ATPase G|uniref:Cation-translocating P-type ATPase n=1 Tax=Patulibacter brassicae TaxID=1705717 RepID=A0ABU4VR76_9ACTN|nr:cation-translocating P-type ATPase [Patulibacter brassicae]MDX8153305.1 cation-translocating P-type ATPase [Patulibacter brassicae]
MSADRPRELPLATEPDPTGGPCGCARSDREATATCCTPAPAPARASDPFDACCAPAPAVRYDECGCAIPDHDVAPPPRLRDVREIRLAVVSGVALGLALAAGALGAVEGVALGLAALAILAGGATFVPGAIRGLLARRLSVGTLMTIAGVGAIALGEVTEAATLAFLFAISEALESYAVTRTRRSLRALLDLVPDRARILRGGREVEVDPAALRRGDVLVVRPGERLATDGAIVRGRSALDVAAITGESMPVERGPGDEVLAGTINGGGALEVEVTATAADNSLARIVRIVEEAQERKGAGQRLAARVARPLVPGVLVAALLIAVVGSAVSGDPAEWIGRALVVLVAAAPCAFAIAVPVTVVAAIGAATRAGVLIKGGAALEALGGVRTVALDKTGTLTRNAPRVVDVLHDERHRREEVLALAAALEARSEHPLARAILAASPDPVVADDVQAIPGDGLVGVVDGEAVRLGRPGFVSPGPWAPRIATLQEQGATVVLLERAGRLAGAVAVRDELREEAPVAVARLGDHGVRRVAMLTGDNARAAGALAVGAGIADVHAELRPEDKARIVDRLRAEGRGTVAMVGDGINDAPALATADVGIAMGAMGSDVAIETADVALLGDDLRALPRTIGHARRANRIMRQNLALSGAILLALVPLAATGALGLAAVVSIHELAEVLVIANGVRAARWPRSAAAPSGPVPAAPALRPTPAR